MINFKTVESYELADLLYDKIVEKGEINFYDYEIDKIIYSKLEYGFRRVIAGAIQILEEKEDVERIVNGKYKSFKFKLREV